MNHRHRDKLVDIHKAPTVGRFRKTDRGGEVALRLKKTKFVLIPVLAIFAFSLFLLPAKAFYFEDIITAALYYPCQVAGYINTDYFWYRHVNMMWGQLDGQGHYLSITWDWEAWCRGYVVYYRRDYFMQFADGSYAYWWDEWMGHKPWGFPLEHHFYDYSGFPPYARPVAFSVTSIVAFSTFQT